MANIEWFGMHAYLKATNARLTFSATTSPGSSGFSSPVGPNYTFTNPWDQIDSGPIGRYVSASEGWSEGLSPNNAQYQRLLRFEFLPRETDGNDAVADAKTSGWKLSSIDALDNAEDDIRWRESYDIFDRNQLSTGVAVDTSDKLFYCNKYKVTLRASQYGDPRGTFEAEDVLFGAFLTRNYDPDAMVRYNVCGVDKECSAVDGVVYCDGVQYDPSSTTLGDGGDGDVSPLVRATHDLDYYGPNSFLDVVDARVAIQDGPDYTFRDFRGRMPAFGSGTFGNRIARDTWQEEYTPENANPNAAAVTRKRELRFFFEPTGIMAGEINEFDVVQRSGYRVNKVQMRDKDGKWIVWENDDSRMVVPVSLGYDYYDCEKIEFDFTDGSSYQSEFSRLGGYLPDAYTFSKLRPYNPCRELQGYSGSCRASNGVVFCGGVLVNGNVVPPTPSPTQEPPATTTAAPPTPPASGIDLEWVGSQAYVSGTDVSAVVTNGADYLFNYGEGKSDPDLLDTNTGGRLIQGEWFESNVRRALYFRAYSTTAAATRPHVLREAKMRDENGNWLWWTDRSGSFVTSSIVIPQGYDGFTCDYAEFTYRTELGSNTESSPVLGTFTARNFKFGNYLLNGYDPSSLRFYDPCRNLPDPSSVGCKLDNSGECPCAVRDGGVSCNGVDVPFGILYPGIAQPGSSPGDPVEGKSAGMTTSGRTGSAAAVVVALVAAAVVQYGGALLL
eukprot:CAMPEP_0197446180 /NCGR_PEP_ID=MMETSP1175-20131217/11193_1 /TAXON_ID=1003142 /ORGANISM="Triceratium dubium, Strain CCMP147" /LENGTH=724 /DNA_ID=CAMNT_0042977257 /DNA_START=316 /DNA_END=2490 /DNA_ORIENTATION=-